MSDLISRQDAIEHFRSLPYNNGLYTDEEVVHELGRIPTATDRKMGEWVICDDEWDITDAPLTKWWYECSLCGGGGNIGFNYCPNCGARMLRGE